MFHGRVSRAIETEIFREWFLLIVASSAASCVMIYWIWQTSAHQKKLRAIPIRVHVNGIRGKSTIVRYIAGALRAQGIQTLAKTTGSDTRVIYPDGSEKPIVRYGAPTILEQISVLRQVKHSALGAIVFECMALRPEYQRASERRMIRATDGVIANIRQDHVEQLGETPPEIAVSLSATAPLDAPLYTADDDPEILDILEREAETAGGWLVPVTGDEITREELRGFSPLVFPENVALALAIARRHGVPREVALDGIRHARPDPGASRIHRHEVAGGTLIWIDLFGVNDVESADINIRMIINWIGDQGELVFLINNREDRQDRSVQFAEMAAGNADAAKILVVGETVAPLSREIRHRNQAARVETPGIPAEATPQDIAVLANVKGSNPLVLVGLANIHTEDAERLRSVLETSPTEWVPGAAAQGA